MAEKPVLHYYNGRGRAEIIRWALAAADVEFDEKFYKTPSEMQALHKTPTDCMRLEIPQNLPEMVMKTIPNSAKSGYLMFQQIPMLEIDGMKLVQTRAILNYIAAKYNLYGSGLKDRAHIDMYVEGTTDLVTLVLTYFFLPECDQEKQKNLMKDKAQKRYFPVYEKALEGKEYLVGNKFSFADVYLMYVILSLEDFHSDILQDFPNLQAFKKRIGELPTIKKFLQPGSKRKPMADKTYVDTVLLLISC